MDKNKIINKLGIKIKDNNEIIKIRIKMLRLFYFYP